MFQSFRRSENCRIATKTWGLQLDQETPFVSSYSSALIGGSVDFTIGIRPDPQVLDIEVGRGYRHLGAGLHCQPGQGIKAFSVHFGVSQPDIPDYISVTPPEK